MPHKLGKKCSVETRILRTSTCYNTRTEVIGKYERRRVACEEALCLGGKNSEEREGKGGVGEPVDKHLRPLFRPLVIILPIICQ